MVRAVWREVEVRDESRVGHERVVHVAVVLEPCCWHWFARRQPSGAPLPPGGWEGCADCFRGNMKTGNPAPRCYHAIE
jgi:hypothetical protein